LLWRSAWRRRGVYGATLARCLFSTQACASASVRVFWMLLTSGTATPSMTGRPWCAWAAAARRWACGPGARRLLDLGDQRHQVVAGQQAGADQQDRRRALQQCGAQRGQRALHQALQVGPVRLPRSAASARSTTFQSTRAAVACSRNAPSSSASKFTRCSGAGRVPGWPKRCSSSARPGGQGAGARSAPAGRLGAGCAAAVPRPRRRRPVRRRAVAGGPQGELGGVARKHRGGAGRLRAAQGRESVGAGTFAAVGSQLSGAPASSSRRSSSGRPGRGCGLGVAAAHAVLDFAQPG
jgi:hypothetical protein